MCFTSAIVRRLSCAPAFRPLFGVAATLTLFISSVEGGGGGVDYRGIESLCHKVAPPEKDRWVGWLVQLKEVTQSR